MRDREWEAPIVELRRPLSAYLLWLVARDLGVWGQERRSKLPREEAVAFAAFLSDFLPAEMRTSVPAPPPMLRVG